MHVINIKNISGRMARISVKRIVYVVLAIYISFSLWVVYVVFLEKKPSINSKLNGSGDTQSIKINKKEQFNGMIDIWGKAAIAEYLWVHIFEGGLSVVPGYLLHKGSVNLENVRLTYTTGPSLIVETANKNVKDLIIILNGREESKVNAAKLWLDALVDKQKFYHLHNLGIVLLGNEMCQNDWLWYYVDKFPILIKFVFIVYDVNGDDARPVYQWPLGVATYRHFPLIKKVDVDVDSKRKYRCNFLGTIYANSSRETLMKLITNGSYNCYMKPRYVWLHKETKETRSIYHDVLKNSDLTLSPVGINSESYRIYEALSYGSVPVLEDVMTPGQCGKYILDNKAPYSLLKKYNAPVIYIKDWQHDLPELLQKEASLTPREIINRRKDVLDWYEIFRYKMREELLRITLHNFE